MELPQARSYGAEGAGRKSTHDFLSLYSNSTAEQDPRPSAQASFLKTHDFLRPLEEVEAKSSAKEEATDEISSVVQKQPPLATPASVEHLLPGGIGTYSISHINSCVNNNQRIPKPEASSLFTVHQATSADRNDDNSNCSSHTSSGFTLWEESEIRKGKTGKENNVGDKPIIGGNHEIFFEDVK